MLLGSCDVNVYSICKSCGTLPSDFSFRTRCRGPAAFSQGNKTIQLERKQSILQCIAYLLCPFLSAFKSGTSTSTRQMSAARFLVHFPCPVLSLPLYTNTVLSWVEEPSIRGGGAPGLISSLSSTAQIPFISETLRRKEVRLPTTTSAFALRNPSFTLGPHEISQTSG
jgi:hypothetical protein